MNIGKVKFKVFILFIFLNLISPWFWVLIKNPTNFKITKNQLYQLSSERRIYEVNTFRGETAASGLGLLGKLAINKYTWLFKEILARAEESFDPYFLFFKGDLDVHRSTWVFGPVFWIFSPLVLIGLLNLSKRRQKKVVGLIFIFALLSSFFEQHYYSPPRIPLFIIFNWLAAYGVTVFFGSKTKKNFRLFYLILITFEISRFIHDFYFHYPVRIAGQ